MQGFEIAPAMQANRNKKEGGDPKKRRNPDFFIQAKLMDRSPLPHEDWGTHYGGAFRKLYDTDETFREMVSDSDASEASLIAIQARLDDWIAEKL